MRRDYPNLCKHLDVAGITLRNCMASAPLGSTYEAFHAATDI